MSSKYSRHKEFGVGSPRQFPYFGVNGSSVDFYVFYIEKRTVPFLEGVSDWIKGTEANKKYFELKKLHQTDVQSFEAAVKELLTQNPKK